MIRLIEVANYRCLKRIRQPLGNFHVLVGPNASGKSTFLDVLAFLSTLVSEGVEAAIDERTQNFYDLLWGRQGTRFELAVEASIPEEHLEHSHPSSCNLYRYECAVDLDEDSKEIRIVDERLLLGDSQQITHGNSDWRQRGTDTSVFLRKPHGGWEELLRKSAKDGYVVAPELTFDPNARINVANYLRGAKPDFRRTIFEILPHVSFPSLEWFLRLLWRIRHLDLSNRSLRLLSPPSKRGHRVRGDGADLPRLIADLEKRAPNQFKDWLAHLRTALPDVTGVRVVERPEDRHRYLMLQYPGGLEVPSWMLSDGTLRLLAFTILPYLPYLPDPQPLYLIEEPENSLHPMNIETVVQSLQSVYDGQVLVATHSPILLANVEPKDMLVFTRDEENGTAIVSGDQHPWLKDWKREVDIGTLYAGGALG